MESPRIRRKANFSEAETEALIALVLRHERLLFGGVATRAAPGHKRRLWEQIRRELSPLAACPRDVEDLQKRWRDLKRRDHARLRRLSAELRKGGSPSQSLSEDLSEDAGPLPPEETLPLPVAGFEPSPAPCNGGFAEEMGPSSQLSFSEMKLKEEIVVRIVVPDEESAVDTTVVPPIQEQFPLIETPYFGSFGEGNVKISFEPHAEDSNSFEQDAIPLLQQQQQVMQFGFESINHNLRLLQHTVQDLSSSVGFMAHTLEAIKNVYVKNNAGPVTYLNSSTQTLAGYRSPSLPGDDRSRSQVMESSSCSTSSASQEPGSHGFTATPLKNIKRENTNGDYYTM